MVQEVNKFNKKSIYSLSWIAFYEKLLQLGTKEFLRQYGLFYKRRLQLIIAKSSICQKRISLHDFETKTKSTMIQLLGNEFLDKIVHETNFSARNHPLSTIHYYIFFHSLYSAALNLGFSSKQAFLNFFAQTRSYLPNCVDINELSLRRRINHLQRVPPLRLQKKLGSLYGKSLVKNKDFLKYNYTLEEIKLALEKEDMEFVVASLGGCNSFYVNKKLQTLRPLIHVTLQNLKNQSWEVLRENIRPLFWKVKLNRIFSGKVPLKQWATIKAQSSSWPFFAPHATQSLSKEADTQSGLHNDAYPCPYSFKL